MTQLDMGDSVVLVEILRRHEASSGLVGVEVGTHRGETAAAVLRAFPDLELLCADPWTVYPPDHPYRRSGDGCSRLTISEQDANCLAAVEATDFAERRCTIMRTTSTVAAERFLGWSGGRLADWVFIDGAHDLESVREDIRLWWPLTATAGLLLGHDYSHSRCKRGLWGVDQAVNEFVERERLKLDLFGSVWCVKKPA